MSARLLPIALDLLATTFIASARHTTPLLHGEGVLHRLAIAQRIILHHQIMAGGGIVIFVGIEERVGSGRGIILVRVVGMRRTGSGGHEGSGEQQGDLKAVGAKACKGV